MILTIFLKFLLLLMIKDLTTNCHKIPSKDLIKRPAGSSFTTVYNLLYSNLGPHTWIFPFKINIRRSHIVEDTIQIFTKYQSKSDNFKRMLHVRFQGEENGDAGGLTTEWFDLFSTLVFNPEFGLFQFSDDHYNSVEINPCSKNNHPDHLNKFEILGIFTGMCIYHRRLINVHFSIPFLKGILNQPINMGDVKKTDEQFYRSLVWLQNGDAAAMEFKFVDEDPCDDHASVELLKNGKNIPVTEKNVKDYVSLKINWKYEKIVEKQMSAFLKGLSALIPLRLLTIFTVDELQKLIAGQEQIDLEYWKLITSYKNCSPFLINWFWMVLESFDNEKRTKLLQFVTGSTRLPVCRIESWKFFIVCNKMDKNKLPLAHTCSHELELPEYSNYYQVLEKLTIVTDYPVGYHMKI